MPQIDPKYAFWFGVWTTVLIVVAGYGLDDAPPLIMVVAPYVKWLAAFSAKINAPILTALAGLSSSKSGPLISVPQSAVKPVVILAALLAGGVLMLPGDAHAAAGKLSAAKSIAGGSWPCDPANLLPGCEAPGATAPATDSDEPCDVSIIIKVTPKNLIPTIKKCVSNANGVIVADTQRALDSAKAFTPNPDQDAVNCLTPLLALFKAGVQVPAVAAQDAVPATPTSPALPAVAAAPAQDPGFFLLSQKYREFVLAGGLTSCQNWVNTPVNATIAASANALGTGAAAATGAALLAPK